MTYIGCIRYEKLYHNIQRHIMKWSHFYPCLCDISMKAPMKLSVSPVRILCMFSSVTKI